MQPLKSRRGTGLTESLVALALAGVVMAAATRGLSQHVRTRRERDDQARADDIVQVVRDVLRAELDHAEPGPRLLGDSAVQLASTRVLALPCDVTPTRLTLPSSAGWWSSAQVGDSVALIDTLRGAEWRTAVVATSTVRASARCPTGGTRLSLAVPLPSSVPALLLPSRVWRVVRYVAYRAGDGTWWMGERSCAPGCASAQPIAGPLAPPSQGGLRLSLVVGNNARPIALDVTARTVLHGRRAAVSARIPLAAVP